MDPINSVSQSTRVTNQANVQAAVSELGSDVFLRLLVTQLQSQDPTNPVQNEDFVAQLAQFTTLEQATNTNDLLEQLVAQNGQRSRFDLVGLLGREVMTEGNTVSLRAEGGEATISYALSGNAAHVKLDIIGPNGALLRTLEPEGIQATGVHSLMWDGESDGGDALPAGVYEVRATAQDSEQQPVPILTFAREVVTNIVPGTEKPIVVQSGKTYTTDDLISIQ